jgi:hypothetical protein
MAKNPTDKNTVAYFEMNSKLEKNILLRERIKQVGMTLPKGFGHWRLQVIPTMEFSKTGWSNYQMLEILKGPVNALATRHLVGKTNLTLMINGRRKQRRYDWDDYNLLTASYRIHFGELHPDDKPADFEATIEPFFFSKNNRRQFSSRFIDQN